MNKKQEERLKKLIEEIWRWYMAGIMDKEELEQFLTNFYHEIRKAERDEIKNDLLKIADKGEIEELRVAVKNYFK